MQLPKKMALYGYALALALLLALSLPYAIGQPPTPSTPPPPPAPAPQLSLHDRATALLNDSLKSKNPDTRKHGVEALSLAALREPYTTQVEAMLDDKDVEVRVATV